MTKTRMWVLFQITVYPYSGNTSKSQNSIHYNELMLEWRENMNPELVYTVYGIGQ